MKLVVNQKSLEKALAHANWIIEKKQAVPILGYVLFEATTGKLTITATNMDMTIVDMLECNVTDAGKYCLPASLLYDIIRKLDSGIDITFAFSKETNSIEVRGKRASFSINYMEAANFPPITDGEYPISFSMSSKILKKSIDIAKVAMLQDNSRFHLNGIHMHYDNPDGYGKLRFVATDLFRISCVSAAVSNEASKMDPIIISKRTVQELLKLIDANETDVRISVSENRISFDITSSDNIKTQFCSRLINGTFPEYRTALEVTNDKVLTLNTCEIAEALDRVSTIVVDTTSSVKLEISQSELVVSGVSRELGSAVEKIDASFNALNPLEICFNSKYLLDILHEIETPQVILLLAESSSSTIIKPAVSESAPDVDMIFAIMPVEIVQT